LPPDGQPDSSSGHAVVTGASSGIGAAIVTRLLQDGWSVTGLSRTAADIVAPSFQHRAVDLLEVHPGDLRAALADIPATALVHAAGVLRVGELGGLDREAGALMWRLHVDSAALLADMLAPRMGVGGRIVLIGSRTAGGSAGRSQYAASKAALVGLARSWAIELAPRGITVNVIAPGATETPMLRDPARAGVAPRLPPSGRFVQPDEIAAVAAFLLSEAACSITGQQIVVCGGASL
jgi:3-oxoacyl-[acyl-carrier protein] reductase